MKKDIIVFGAGLAGLYAAKEAAIHDANVCVVERKKDVGALKCGELFTTIYGMPPSVCITNEIKNWVFDYSLVNGLENKSTIVNLPDGFAVMTDREKHERILKEQCNKLGVDFVFGKITLDYNPEDYDFVIMATGASCWKGKTAMAVSHIIKTDENRGRDYAYFKVLSDMKGYYWAFPRNENEINAGVGYDKDSEFFGKLRYNDIVSNISRFADNSDLGARELSNIGEKVNSGGGQIPVNVDYKERYNYINTGILPNAVYVGDAAGLVNPMLCGGEHLAMLSGQLAGYTAATEDDTETAQENYYQAITEIIAPEMEMGIFVNNMREILSPLEYYDFMSSALGARYIDMNSMIIKYIQRTMPKWRKIPEAKNEELEKLL